MTSGISRALKSATEDLSAAVSACTFTPPVTHVYNPLSYAQDAYYHYLDLYGSSTKRVLFLGMNPGPWGMAQTGIPFGEISAVQDWLKIGDQPQKPALEHPARPILGFQCPRSEVSGRRLWGLFSDRFISAKAFFEDHFVANYCPLIFMEESGKNRTPDKLPASEKKALFSACDTYLVATVELLRPSVVIGVGKFAANRAKQALSRVPDSSRPDVQSILHPSPASPAANRGWAEQAQKQLLEIGVWDT